MRLFLALTFLLLAAVPALAQSRSSVVRLPDGNIYRVNTDFDSRGNSTTRVYWVNDPNGPGAVLADAISAKVKQWSENRKRGKSTRYAAPPILTGEAQQTFATDVCAANHNSFSFCPKPAPER